MRILFACTRGAGHFNPMVPFIEACRRGGHDVVVVGPPPLRDAVERARYPFLAGAAPPDDELGRVWAKVPTLSYDEAERLVIGEIFATLNVRAMLPALRAIVLQWRPDVIVREPAEFASAIVAEEAGVAHVQVAIGLAVSHVQMLSMASVALEDWDAGLTERIAATPYLTLFPESLEDPEVASPPHTHRFRDAQVETAAHPLTDWWPGDDRPLVYVTFGSMTASVPTAAAIYDVALEAVADLAARVLLTTGDGFESQRSVAPPIARARHAVGHAGRRSPARPGRRLPRRLGYHARCAGHRRAPRHHTALRRSATERPPRRRHRGGNRRGAPRRRC